MPEAHMVRMFEAALGSLAIGSCLSKCTLFVQAESFARIGNAHRARKRICPICARDFVKRGPVFYNGTRNVAKKA